MSEKQENVVNARCTTCGAFTRHLITGTRLQCLICGTGHFEKTVELNKPHLIQE